MSFAANYHQQLLGTLESIDFERVNQAIQWLGEARDTLHMESRFPAGTIEPHSGVLNGGADPHSDGAAIGY